MLGWRRSQASAPPGCAQEWPWASRATFGARLVLGAAWGPNTSAQGATTRSGMSPTGELWTKH
eukprot:8610281-Pyramimonas_sp.AAC.1